jgi:hypothetical protein
MGCKRHKKMLILTKRAKEVLTILRDTEDELVHLNGQWWIDDANIRISPQTANLLLGNLLISANSANAGKSEYYYINEACKRWLAGEDKIYRAASGRYYESISALKHGEGLK